MIPVTWNVRVTQDFAAWYATRDERGRAVIDRGVALLAERGIHLGAPHSTRIVTSRHATVRELRLQDRGHPIRVLYAFDPTRTAVLLCGGDKTGDDRFYERTVPIADRLYDQRLGELKAAGLG